jgi:dihydroorotase
MHTKPCERFKIGGEITDGAAADFTVFDLNSEYTIDSNEFLSMGKSTPFEGMRVCGSCLMTAVNGNIVWIDKEYIKDMK